MASDSTRMTAVKIMQQLLLHNGSLSTLLDKFNPQEDDNSRALLQALCYGLCRHYEQLAFISERFLTKPLRKKDQDLYCLILVGIYQLFFMHMPDYAVMNGLAATKTYDQHKSEGEQDGEADRSEPRLALGRKIRFPFGHSCREHRVRLGISCVGPRGQHRRRR